MTETRFDLIFEGKVEPGHDPDDVRRTLEGLFQFDGEAQAELFSGQPVVLSESMDAATASSFQQALAGAGVTTCLVEASDEAAAVATPERRSAHRRSYAPRRAQTRTAAILPDRRQGRDRRR